MLPTDTARLCVGHVHGSFPHRCRNGRTGLAQRWGRFSCVFAASRAEGVFFTSCGPVMAPPLAMPQPSPPDGRIGSTGRSLHPLEKRFETWRPNKTLGTIEH